MILKLSELLRNGGPMVFFGGAGTSTESNIPDFRSPDGLYSKKFMNIPPEEILSIDFMQNNPRVFFEYLRTYLYFPDVKPNAGHFVLSKLEKQGILKTVITQNIDALHQKAGSKNVVELHGSFSKSHCVKCGTEFEGSFIFESTFPDMVPRCINCGGMVRPDVVLYGEPLDQNTIEQAIKAIEKAETLIIGGTSLAVYPAASFIKYFKGTTIVLLNKDQTPYDHCADLIIREPIGETLRKAYEIAFEC